MNRIFYALVFTCSILLYNAEQLIGYTQIFALEAAQQVYRPHNITELQHMVTSALQEGLKISLIGAGKSQGGQTMSDHEHACRISLEHINHFIALNIRTKEVTVEAGMTWKQLQRHIAPHGLAVKAMQSYHDFSIGGSLSVNVHGQDLATGQIIRTVQSFTMINSAGELLKVSRAEHPELFKLVIGGYGLFGIIIEVTLKLTDDILLERQSTIIGTDEFVDYFYKNINSNPEIQFYSARFSMGSSDLLERAFVITYTKADNEKMAPFPLAENDEFKRTLLRKFFELAGTWSWLKERRFAVEKLFLSGTEIISRNNFLNRSITVELAHDNDKSQYILQEYFIPYNRVISFIEHLKQLVKEYKINLLNVTARHVFQDNESMLSFAPAQDMCALVLYMQVHKDEYSYKQVADWTNKVVDQALQHQGTYYLPYQLLATQAQLAAAYPRWQEFVMLKKQYDPVEIFTNKLYEKYA